MDYKNYNLISASDCDRISLKQVQEYYSKFINPALSKSLRVFSFGNDLVKSANNLTITLCNKSKILDFTGGLGVLNFGHNPKTILKERINFQKKSKMEVHKNFFSQYSAALAHNIAQITPKTLNYSYFCNSGAEAIDGAIKLAYKSYNGKRNFILHSDIAFHGKLLGSLSVSSASENAFMFPKINFGKKYKFNNIQNFEKIIQKYKKKIFAVIVEPYSASTYKENSTQFLQKCRSLCDKYDIKLIFDEIYTGFGKTGHLFHCVKKKITPDILIISKSFGGGKSSISAYVTNKNTIMKSYGNLNDVLVHSTTYNGFGEECLTAIASINLMIKKKYYLNGEKIRDKMAPTFKRLKEIHKDKIKDFRGVGAMFGFTFYTKYLPIKKIQKLLPFSVLKDQKFLDKLLASALLDELYRKYKILGTLKFNREVIFCLEPSLTVNDKEISKCLSSIEKLFNENFNKIILKFLIRSIKINF
jgi:putrescine aminotransferase